LKNHLKNLFGWKTKRKLVAFAIDDYGNVRLDSPQAFANLQKAGLPLNSRFDQYDTLETREDLEALFDTLRSVKDQNHYPAIFTPFALSCNINFEAMAADQYRQYQYETLPQTFQKQAQRWPKAYEGAWSLWQEGIREGLMAPQFHGREHLNLQFFRDKLNEGNQAILTALQNRSYTGIPVGDHPVQQYTAAFAFWEKEEAKNFPAIITDGVAQFQIVFGYSPTVFTPPAQEFPPWLESELSNYGLKATDKPFLKKQHLGQGKYRWQWNNTCYDRKNDRVKLVRNVVFEPTNNPQIDWVNHALQQIEAAFYWDKPALISSHRVNFCGFIDPENRRVGLSALKELLQKIVQKWPEVEFVSAGELAEIIEHR